MMSFMYAVVCETDQYYIIAVVIVIININVMMAARAVSSLKQMFGHFILFFIFYIS